MTYIATIGQTDIVFRETIVDGDGNPRPLSGVTVTHHLLRPGGSKVDADSVVFEVDPGDDGVILATYSDPFTGGSAGQWYRYAKTSDHGPTNKSRTPFIVEEALP